MYQNISITPISCKIVIQKKINDPIAFLMSENLYFDILFCILSHLAEASDMIKVKNGGHFGRHLEFQRCHQRDSRGLLICYSGHFSEHFLKFSACY